MRTLLRKRQDSGKLMLEGLKSCPSYSPFWQLNEPNGLGRLVVQFSNI